MIITKLAQQLMNLMADNMSVNDATIRIFSTLCLERDNVVVNPVEQRSQ